MGGCNASIKGAYVSSIDTILLSKSLENDAESLDLVLLEEIGHWLEGPSLFDSEGDEGEKFSKLLLETIHL